VSRQGQLAVDRQFTAGLNKPKECVPIGTLEAPIAVPPHLIQALQATLQDAMPSLPRYRHWSAGL